MLKSSDVFSLFDPAQLSAYRKLKAENGGIIWMHVGDGKTRPALMAAWEISWDYPIIIVICRRVAFDDWKEEIATLQLDCQVLLAEDVPPKAEWPYKAIVLMSEGKINNDLIDALDGLIGCVIIDEGYLYKNPRSQHSLAVAKFNQKHPTILVSGSVMTARDIVDIYGQVSAVGRCKELAPTLTRFRSLYQNGIQGNFFTWQPKPTAYKEIMERIEPFTYLHMPDIRRVQTKTQIFKVQPTPRQYALFKELKETAAVEGKFELNNMANVITKAQQISNGWLKDDEGNVEYFESTKVNRTVGLVDELLHTDYKQVIWCAFREDIARLKEGLKVLNCNVATFMSGKPFDVEQWKRKDCRICLATEAMGSSVNHFAQVPYAIYFSQDSKFHSLQQSQGRHTRRSSEHPIAYFLYLHTDKSLDSRVYWTVQASRRSEKSFIRQMDVLQWINAQ